MMAESNGSPHLEWQMLVDAIESPASLAPAMHEHLRTCSACRTLHESARALLAVLGRARLPAIPDELLALTLERLCREGATAAVAASADRSPSSAGAAGRWEQLLSDLRARLDELVVSCVADSLAASPALRGAAMAGVRSRLFETATHAISVALERPAGRAPGTLRGQVIPQSGDAVPEGCRAYLYAPDGLSERCIGPLGEFVFEAAPAPPLRLVVVIGPRFARIESLAELEPPVELDPT